MGAAAAGAAAEPVGALLSSWRRRRRLTQLELSLRAGVSTRHLSFIETGRSLPTSDMILLLSEQLDIPLRERNALLLAGGYAPAYPQHRLSDPPLAAVNDAINRILAAHAPYPALVIDRHWDLVAANAAVDLLTAGSAPHLLEPPVNVLRLSLHPDGMASRIVNLGQWCAHVLERLAREISGTADAELVRLRDELTGYPAHDLVAGSDPTGLVVPLRIRTPAGELSVLSTTTVFGTPRDVTVAELAIESFYPTDRSSAEILRRR
ncbi:MAG: helix-turn-helix domain-containing protein [Micromonosporaceae bacterium]|nr:helix-turn-helix domain-containing protein [Micromonosporaceae bacterium]